MKITAIRTVVVNAVMRNWIFVRVETDQPGLYGWGEATLEWKTRAVVGAVEDLTPLLIGRDPRDIEQLVRIMHKHGFWRIGVIGTTAISGIEVALWDILGKALGVPVWRLLGGRTRDRVRVYTHLGMGESGAVYRTMSSSLLVERAQAVLARGYRAMKVVFIPYTHYTASPRAIDHVGRLMRDLREAVGDEIEIMVDFHGRCASASVALQYIDALAPGRPLFVEEPVQPGDPDLMRAVSEKSRVPIAAGERLVDRLEFRGLFERSAITIAQPDLCHVGGFTEARKIASMAEAAGVGIAPHNPLGPLAGVAALHFDVATPNFVIQEEMVGAVPWYGEVLQGPIRMVDGSWQVPEAPGLGVEIDERVAAAHPFAPETHEASEAVLEDGTIVDW
ncbi:MAG TPA: galactonate dehydratase [Acetobacteraceae bacterium]|nr:galactonate dehydratase [Acetobacteraceae bacterium]